MLTNAGLYWQKSRCQGGLGTARRGSGQRVLHERGCAVRAALREEVGCSHNTGEALEGVSTKGSCSGAGCLAGCCAVMGMLPAGDALQVTFPSLSNFMAGGNRGG